MTVDVEKLRTQIDRALAEVDQVAYPFTGGGVPELKVDLADQFRAQVRDYLTNLGLDTNDPDHVHAALAGVSCLGSLWGRWTIDEAFAWSRLCRMLLAMTEGLKPKNTKRRRWRH